MTTHTPLEKKFSPELIAEAAMCIWEYMLESRPDKYNPAPGTWMYAMVRLWDKHGTVEMRHYAYRLALEALEVCERLGHDWMEEHDLIPYDWEFLPAVVRAADWTALYGSDNSASRIIKQLKETYE